MIPESELLYRNFTDEIPTNINVLREPIKAKGGNENNFAEYVVIGDVAAPGISLEPIEDFPIGVVECAYSVVDAEGRYAGKGYQVSGFLMGRMVSSEHVRQDVADADKLRVEAREGAKESIMEGIYYMLGSGSVEKAVERVSQNG